MAGIMQDDHVGINYYGVKIGDRVLVNDPTEGLISVYVEGLNEHRGRAVFHYSVPGIMQNLGQRTANLSQILCSA